MSSPFDLSKPVAIGSDHAGYDLKEELISFLEAKDLAYHDYGTHSKDSVDYPDFAHPVSDAVEKGEAAFGILLCGSANGVAITANKHKGILYGQLHIGFFNRMFIRFYIFLKVINNNKY